MLPRAVRALPALAVTLALAGCGLAQSTPHQPDGKSAAISLSLTTVPTIRSVTVSPGKASFGSCGGGSLVNNTASSGNELGYPNGTCWVGSPDPYGIFPIKITNTGIASYIDVNASSASPSDGGDEWGLCNLGRNPAVSCSAHGGRAPGIDQYVLENFSATGAQNGKGLTGTPDDHEFSPAGSCWATEGTSQTEGVELIGPSATSDDSTSWTLTITWTPVPG